MSYRQRLIAIGIGIVAFIALCVWWLGADHSTDTGEGGSAADPAPTTIEDRPAGNGADGPLGRGDDDFVYPEFTPEPGNPAPTAPATSPLPEGAPNPDEVDRRDPDAVAETVAALSVSWDTRHDADPAAGIQRAGALLTPELLEKQVSPLRGATGWAEPAAHKAHSAAHLRPVPGTDRPGDTPERVHRTFLADWTWHGQDDWTGPGHSRVVNLTLDKRGEDWIVTAYSFIED